MGLSMARRTKRLWTDAEKRSICFQTAAPDVSVAQVAHRYAVNANLIFKWLSDPRYAPEAGPAIEEVATDVVGFLPVEIIDRPQNEEPVPAVDPEAASGTIEIDVAGGHRLRIVGTYDPEALARLIRGLSQ